MIHARHDESDPGQSHGARPVKRPISERKLQANRANAKRSTGPRTEAGKAVSRQNALKHGIRSHSIESPSAIPGVGLGLLNKDESLVSGNLLTESASREMTRIWEKMARVLALEKECMQRPGGLAKNGHLLHRYERMLTTQLHARIRELSGVATKTRKDSGRSA